MLSNDSSYHLTTCLQTSLKCSNEWSLCSLRWLYRCPHRCHRSHRRTTLKPRWCWTDLSSFSLPSHTMRCFNLECRFVLFMWDWIITKQMSAVPELAVISVAVLLRETVDSLSWFNALLLLNCKWQSTVDTTVHFFGRSQNASPFIGTLLRANTVAFVLSLGARSVCDGRLSGDAISLLCSVRGTDRRANSVEGRFGESCRVMGALYVRSVSFHVLFRSTGSWCRSICPSCLASSFVSDRMRRIMPRYVMLLVGGGAGCRARPIPGSGFGFPAHAN